jgi:hypothetical protein
MATKKEAAKKEEQTRSRAVTEENTPEQPLGTEDPRHFELSDLAPAASGSMDHLNPGVPGDLPNEMPAAVPTDLELAVSGFRPSPTATVRRDDDPEVRRGRK